MLILLLFALILSQGQKQQLGQMHTSPLSTTPFTLITKRIIFLGIQPRAAKKTQTLLESAGKMTNPKWQILPQTSPPPQPQQFCYSSPESMSPSVARPILLDQSDMDFISLVNEQAPFPWLTPSRLDHIYSYLHRNGSKCWLEAVMKESNFPLFMQLLKHPQHTNGVIQQIVERLKGKAVRGGVFKKRQSRREEQNATYEQALLMIEKETLEICNRYKQCDNIKNSIERQNQEYNQKVRQILQLRK